MNKFRVCDLRAIDNSHKVEEELQFEVTYTRVRVDEEIEEVLTAKPKISPQD